MFLTSDLGPYEQVGKIDINQELNNRLTNQLTMGVCRSLGC